MGRQIVTGNWLKMVMILCHADQLMLVGCWLERTVVFAARRRGHCWRLLYTREAGDLWWVTKTHDIRKSSESGLLIVKKIHTYLWNA